MRKARGPFTLMLIPASGGKIRRVVIPRFIISVCITGIVIGFFTLFYFINEYKIMKEKVRYLEDLEELAKMQQEKILSLAEKVKEFDATMSRIEEMEAKLRSLAGAGGGGQGGDENWGEGGPDTYTPFKSSLAPQELIEEGVDSLKIISKIEDKVSSLEFRASKQEKALSRVEELIEEKKQLFASTPNIFPVEGWISAGYGWRINPFTGKREFHRAIDIVAPWGTEVKAACQGKVTYAGWKDFYGLVVEIKNSYGYTTRYAHLSRILVKKGKNVEKGEVIGRLGSSGRSTGPHLHFEVWRRGKSVNPLELMVEPLDLS